MADNDVVRGADALIGLSKRLKAAGDKEARKALHKGVAAAAKPLVPKVKEAARNSLPKSGGLNRRIANKSYRPQVRTGAKTAGVRIVGSKVDPRINNEGRIFHPVFGRKPGVVQHVPEAKGYFDDTIQKNAGPIRDAIVEELEGMAKYIAGGHKDIGGF